jgi:hypothetical protein
VLTALLVESTVSGYRPLPMQFYEWSPHAADEVCLKKKPHTHTHTHSGQSKLLLHLSAFSLSATVILYARYNANVFFELGLQGRVSFAVELVS